jgi:hypothetical protein
MRDQDQKYTKKRDAYRGLTIFLVIISVVYCIFSLFPASTPTAIDLIQYWSAAKVLSAGQNPYDRAQLLLVQSSVSAATEPIIMWNPPFIVPLIYVFSLLNFHSLRVLWSSASIGAVLTIILTGIRFEQSSHTTVHHRALLYLLFATFVPIIETIGWGQISVVLLIAISSWWVRYQAAGVNSWQAGAWLSLTLIKPHLFLVLYLVIILTSLKQRCARLIAGFLIAATILASFALLIEPRVFSWYLNAMSAPPTYWRNPNLGSVFQHFLPQYMPLSRFLPVIGASIAILLLSLTKSMSRYVSNPETHLACLVFSLMVAPYGWIYDQLVLVPFLLLCAQKLSERAHSKSLTVLISVAIISHFSMLILPNNWGQEKGLISLGAYCLLAVYITYCRSDEMKTHIFSAS